MPGLTELYTVKGDNVCSVVGCAPDRLNDRVCPAAVLDR